MNTRESRVIIIPAETKGSQSPNNSRKFSLSLSAFVLSDLCVPFVHSFSLQPFFFFYFCHPSCCHHLFPSLPPWIHPSTANAFKNHKACIFSFIHMHSSVSFFSIPLSLSLHPLLPVEIVIMAAGNGGQTRKPEWQNHDEALLVYSLCSPHVSFTSWPFVGAFCELSQSYLRCSRVFSQCVCISLFQPAAGRVCLTRWWCCCCCFDAIFELILSLNALNTAPDGGISLHLQTLTLILVIHP